MPTIDPIVEIEFTAGVWTNVSTDVDLTSGIPIRFGRTSEFAQPSAATCDIKLANPLGKYTPKTQLLSDGTTANPYYPNVVPRKRLRVRNSSGTRFVGYIKSWSPLLENGVRAYVAVSAVDRQDQLSRIALKSMWEYELAATMPLASYLMNEVGSDSNPAATLFADTSSTKNGPLQYADSGNATALVGGASSPMPKSDGLTGVTVGGTLGQPASVIGPALAVDGDFHALAAWVTVPIGIGNTYQAFDLRLSSVNTVATSASPISIVTLLASGSPAPGSWLLQTSVHAGASGAPSLASVAFSAPDDGLPHHVAVILSTSGATQTITLYCDGVSVGSQPFGSGQLTALPPVYPHVTLTNTGGSGQVCAGVNVWSGSASIAALPAQLVTLRAAGQGLPGDTTGGRMVRLMGYLGITSGDYLIDTGKAVLSGEQPLRGVSVVAACQALAETEGGGASFYILPDGRLRFADRAFRTPTAAALMTLNATTDLQGDVVPAFDDLTLVNQSTVSRAGGNAMIDTDDVSIAAYSLSTDTATSYASKDTDALYLAQQRVSSQSTPSLRFPQFTVDLFTAETAGLAAAAANLQIGSRVGILGLPVSITPSGGTALYVEGWTEAISKGAWTLQFDASPADNPARMVWDSTTYGLWQASGVTLTSSITAGATTLSLTTAAGSPPFTQVSARYPMLIKIGEELLLIVSAPASAVSPQSVTVLRGVSNTRAAPQSAGSTINLSPAACWTL